MPTEAQIAVFNFPAVTYALYEYIAPFAKDFVYLIHFAYELNNPVEY